ncbi:MAG: oxidoreductase [Betaproteobacteria bacterium]|nr:oxidoreductase [Betaproteobacteria bacterium]
MSARLFEPLAIGGVTVPNRIVVAPMCQYSAHDGCADPDWHSQNLMNLAMSGAGLVMIEATGVERLGRITHGCLGLWSDDNQSALARVLAAARRVALPGTRFGIQLGHAGRKASAQRPFEGGNPLSPHEDPWTTVSASAVPFDASWHVPEALDESGIDRVQKAFVASTRRAVALGFDVVEMHAAHGYLVHQFCSPLSNRRTDRYGGSFENRIRFALETAGEMRVAMPANVALGARITGSDWSPEGITVDEAVAFARALKGAGVDYVCVTSGGLVPGVKIPVAPGYQLPFAERIKAESGIVTRAVGMIVQPQQAESIIASGQADQVALARGFIDDPRWGWHAAQALGAAMTYPPQYDRVGPSKWPGAALARPGS